VAILAAPIGVHRALVSSGDAALALRTRLFPQNIFSNHLYSNHLSLSGDLATRVGCGGWGGWEHTPTPPPPPCVNFGGVYNRCWPRPEPHPGWGPPRKWPTLRKSPRSGVCFLGKGYPFFFGGKPLLLGPAGTPDFFRRTQGKGGGYSRTFSTGFLRSLVSWTASLAAGPIFAPRADAGPGGAF